MLRTSKPVAINMALYFFHLNRMGQIIIDPEGTEFADLDEARREAVLEAREVIIQILRSGKPVLMDDSIDIADEHGAALGRVAFSEALAYSGPFL